MAASPLLVTRPQPDADRTAAHLAALGIGARIAPLFEMRTRPVTLPDPSRYAAIALTSTNALRALMEATDIAPWRGVPVFTVGDGSASAAGRAGFRHITSASGTLADLVAAIVAAAPNGEIFYPAAAQRSGDLAGPLAAEGLVLDMHVLYDMVAIDSLPPDIVSPLERGDFAGALFYSRRAGATFAALTEGENFAAMCETLECLCISEAAALPLVEAGFPRISLADRPDHDGMMTLALAFAREQISP